MRLQMRMDRASTGGAMPAGRRVRLVHSKNPCNQAAALYHAVSEIRGIFLALKPSVAPASCCPAARQPPSLPAHAHQRLLRQPAAMAGDHEDAPLLLHAEAVAPPSPGPPQPSAKAELGSALRVEARTASTPAALHAAATGMPWGITAGAPGGAARTRPATSAACCTADSHGCPLHCTPRCCSINRLLGHLRAGLLLTDMVGIGSLAMPSVFARLGWLVSGGGWE